MIAVMAKKVLLLISVLLAVARTQESSCPLDSCSLVDQVNVCNNGSVSGGCSGSCVTALRGGGGGSSRLEDCCNRIVELINSTPDTTGDGRVCTATDNQFGRMMNRVSTGSLQGEIREGAYIIRDSDRFKFTCSGCIQSIQLAVSPGSVVKSAQGNERITFQLFANRTVDKSIFKQNRSFSLNSSILQSSGDRTLVEYRGSTDSCFRQGDVFGFTIEAESGVALLSTFIGEIGDFIHNVSARLPTSACPQLSSNGLYQFDNTPANNLQQSPLIFIETGPPPEPPSTTEPPVTTDATTMSILSQTGGTTQSPSSIPGVPTTDGLASQSPAVPGYVLYAAGGFAGVICLLLVLVILVVSIYIFQKRKHRVYLYGGKDHKFVPTVPGSENKNDDIAVTAFSQRMSHFMDHNSNENVITIENEMADPLEPAFHHYDMPSELNKERLAFHNGQTLAQAPSQSFISMQTTMSSVSGTGSGYSKTYDSAPELGNRRHGGTVKNPLYQQATDLQEPTYDIPAELNAHQVKKINTMGTSLEEDGIYTETGGMMTPDLPLTPLSMDNESHYSPPPDDFDQETSSVAFNPYHELLPGEVDNETGHHYFFLETEKRNRLQVDSLGRHRVYEPGVYVPDAEERKWLTMKRGENPGSIYEIFEEKHRRNSGKKKKFFREEDQFWTPDDSEERIYNQLSEKQYREILRSQIKFEDHVGVGQFGSVCRATWTNEEGIKTVAVKTLKPTILTDKKIKFLQEGAIMGQFFHSNVIRMFGLVTVGEPVMIVMELMALGDLSKYLWENYRLNKKTAPQPVTLLSFCRQVACGMKYLAKKKYVHRDLAARNVFVSETLVCKIGDFGMSRRLEENYYLSSGGSVPIKWTAPEGLNYKKFSSASDVYSYGMLMYEIWSLGEKPLANIKIADVANLITQGYCQPPPPGCPRKIYETMVKCWDPRYNNRPTFDDLFELLNQSDSDVLSWSETDRALCTQQAMQIGAPVAEGASLYQDLQKTYQITLV